MLLLDKTGTITIGNRKATNFYPNSAIEEDEFIRICALSSMPDETPEGKSIVELAKISSQNEFNVKIREVIKFTAETRTSGVILDDNTVIRKGAYDAIRNYCENAGHDFPEDSFVEIERISSNGGTPLVVSVDDNVMGVIELQDIIKTGISERFKQLAKWV